MDIPPVDIAYLAERLPSLTELLLDAWDEDSDETVTPPVLCDALNQLLIVLRDHEDAQNNPEADTRLKDGEVAEMVEYGIRLLGEAGRRAQRLGLTDTARDFESLTLPLSIWGSRQGAEITRLKPIVNTLAQLANTLRDPKAMIRLVATMDEVVDAVSPEIPDSDDEDKQEPWRFLLMNRAIVATRTQQPALMEPAFDAIVEWIPEEADRFFTEGMTQMDTVGYPEPVREIMQTYFLRYSGERTLH